MVNGVVNCNNCGACEREVLFPRGVAQKHQIVRCMNCGLMYAYPRATANIANYVAAGQTGEPMSLHTPSVIRSFDKLPDYGPIGQDLRKLLPRGKALLEVGCHAGVLLDRFREQGWGVSGVEPDGRAANFARSHYRLDVKGHRRGHSAGVAAGRISRRRNAGLRHADVSSARQARAQSQLRWPHCFLHWPHVRRSPRTVRIRDCC